MKNKIIISITIAALMFTSTAYGVSFFEVTPTITNAPLTTEQTQEVIEGGIQWLLNAQEPSGHFKYEYAPYWDKYIDDDNIVRQVGVLYSLGEIMIRDDEGKYDLVDTMELTLDYVEDNSINDNYGGREFTCIKYEGNRCSLGGVSLALTGLLDFVEAEPKKARKYEELIEAYKEFILAMKLPNEGFMGFYYYEGRQNKRESPFANGQALLALAKYQNYKEDVEVEGVIEDAWKYYRDYYTDQFDHSFYLWGMAAIKVLYVDDPREEYYQFVSDYTEWALIQLQSRRGLSRNRCPQIEGIASAYSVLEPKLLYAQKVRYLEELDFWLTKISDFQLNDTEKLYIRFNHLTPKNLVIKNPRLANGGFLNDYMEPFQRIDVTQHCITSYAQRLVDIAGEEL